MTKSWAALGALAALTLLLAPGAAAHAVLLESSPTDGARLDAAPGEAWVRLSEPVDEAHAKLEVTDRDGRLVGVGATRIENGPTPRLSVALPAGLPDGPYGMRWSVLSRDGHTTSGTVGFAVGPFEPPTGSSPDADRPDPAAAAGRAVLYAGLAVGLGGAAFAARAPLEPAFRRRLAAGALAVGAALHLAGLLLLAWDTQADTGLAPAAFRASDTGRLLVLRALAGAAALALSLAWLPARSRARAGPWVVAGLLAAAGLGSSALGHNAVLGLPFVALDFLHLLAASLWLGGLAAFALLLARPAWAPSGPALRQTGRRFASLALGAVILLAASGLALSLALLAPIGPGAAGRALGSAYGRVLLGKVLLAAGMVALGAVNRYVFLEDPKPRGLAAAVQRWARPLWDGDEASRGRRMARVLAVEASVGAAVLVLAGLLASVSPPAAAQPEGSLEATALGESFHGVLRLSPAPVAGGTSEARLFVAGHDGAPVAGHTCGRDTCLKLTVAAAGEPGAAHFPQPEGDGWWRVPGQLLWLRSGPHDLTLEVQTQDVFLDTLAFQATVA